MKTSDFSFDLPEELIAQHPSKERQESRLLVLERTVATGGVQGVQGSQEEGDKLEEHLSHHRTSDFPELLPDDALLVVNNAKVRKARIYGTSETGGSVELLLLEEMDREKSLWKAMVSKAKRQQPGKVLHFPEAIRGEIMKSRELSETPFRLIRFSGIVDDSYLQLHGHMPLPPYIRREDSDLDEERYQTHYAEKSGSVAAPTAGLHFTPRMFRRLEERSIPVVKVTLHVGLGTFLPVRSEIIEEHDMHRERYEVSETSAEAINRAKREGRRIVAVGTTSVRTLESAFNRTTGEVEPGISDTALFIYPGYRFQVVDQLFTNFHTPKSTLLMLVSAFAGKELIDYAYSVAVRERYRFFSYGDAMYIR